MKKRKKPKAKKILTPEQLAAVLDDVSKEIHNELEQANESPADERPSVEIERAPVPALVDGKPIEVMKLSDGRSVYVAANKDGSPMYAADGSYVVIDPQTGRLRSKAKKLDQVWGQGVVPLPATQGLEAAQKRLGKKTHGAMAFIKAMVPVKDLYRKFTRTQKVGRWALLVIARIVVFFKRAYRKVAGLKTAWKNRKFKSVLNIERLRGIEKYLPINTIDLMDTPIASTVIEVDGPHKLAFARYASVRVPLEPDGTIAEKYIKRWANFLQFLVDEGMWKHGTLAPPSVIELGRVNLTYEKLLFTYIFTDQIPEDDSPYASTAVRALNEYVGFDVFWQEGQIPDSTDWDNFPF